MADLALLIPAQNEADCIKHVVEGFLKLERNGSPLIGEIVVVNNNSTDDTEEIARAAGATVVSEPRSGYGSACLCGLAYLNSRPGGPPEIVALADGDGVAEPNDLQKVIEPIESGEADFVLGSRPKLAEPGSLTTTQRFGNWLACGMIRSMYGVRFTDLAPVRAIEWQSLIKLAMEDTTYGWSIEMQVKAANHKLRVREVDVLTYPRMGGVSKVSGTVKGIIGAGWKIITTIFKYR